LIFILMPPNGPLAAAVQGLLGELFVFVSSLSYFNFVRYPSLGLHGFGCKLVMHRAVLGCKPPFGLAV
jgi:hypothetical protein